MAWLQMLLMMMMMVAAAVFAAAAVEWNGPDPRSHLPATGSKPAKLLPQFHSLFA
jgi:hypothetical protein